jgi:hypothetical protein
MHSSFSYICLFQFSTCIEHSCVHHQENKLYQYDTWYMSLYVGDRLGGSSIQTCIPDGHQNRVTYTMCHIDTINSPDDGHMGARNM